MKDEKCLVTVVITTCKRSPEIVRRAVQSVINQTYSEWELILIDDSPNDYEYRHEVKGTITCLKVNNNIRYVANEKNSGACFSRNIGLEMANGEFIAYLDDDDEWLPEKLQKQVYALKNTSSNVALVYNPFYRIQEGNDKLELIQRPLRSGNLYDVLMNDGNIFGGMSMPLMRTECVRKSGGFDIMMQSAQDLDLWLRIAQNYEVISFDDPLVIYHVHEGEQITSNPEKKIAGLERLYEKNKQYLDEHREIKWKRNLRLIGFYLAAEKRKEAFAIWRRTVPLCPMNILVNVKFLKQILMTR